MIWELLDLSPNCKLRVPVGTVRDWEQHRRSPGPELMQSIIRPRGIRRRPQVTLLGMVDTDPKAALALIEKGMGSRQGHNTN